MQIAVDARPIAARWTGDRTYLLNLLRTLPCVAPAHDYLAYLREPDRSATLRSGEGYAVRRVPSARGATWTPVAVPQALTKDGIDVFHAVYVVPPLAPCATVVTVHDVSFRLFPRWFSLREYVMQAVLVGLSMLRSRLVVVPTSATKRDIVRTFGLSPRKVRVTPYAASRAFAPQDPAESAALVARRHNLTRPYVLGVGFGHSRKNVERLVLAWQAVMRNVAAPTPLVLVGHVSPAARAALMRRLGSALHELVRFTGYVCDGDLPALYAAAEAFVYPSLYEGFGLPVLEAMASGTPVITSAVSSLPEVAGNAALLVNPYSVDAIASALAEVLESPELRLDLRERGLRRAAEFSWERCARQTAQLYAEATSLTPEE
jgi:glycosyltransferase involved in cell wall biosynthesis